MSRREDMDLVVLVPDLDLSGTVRCLLNRPESIGIRPVSFLIDKHPQHDGGCRSDAVQRLRRFIRDYRYGLVIFDKDGSGNPRESRDAIEHDVELQLSRNGWPDRCKAIVIEPELEAWIWNGSEYVAQVLGWKGGYASLRDWLGNRGLWSPETPKPADPKRALEVVLQTTKKPRSASLYRKIAETVDLHHCDHPAFNELKSTLQRWFPRSEITGGSQI